MELQILHWFQSIQNPILNPIMYGFTLLAEDGIFLIVLGALMLFLFPKQYRKIGLTILMSLLLSLIVCNLILKPAVHRIRPYDVDSSLIGLYGMFAKLHDFSFPSGHTSASFATALAIFMWKKREGIVAIAIACVIAVSRLYLTVHYPTDVLVSLFLGSIFGILGYFIVKQLLKLFEAKVPFLKYWFIVDKGTAKKKAATAQKEKSES